MRILYQYRSRNFNAPSGQPGHGCVHWPDDPFNYQGILGEDSISCRLSQVIQSPGNAVNLTKHLHYDSDSLPTVRSYSCASRNEDYPEGRYRISYDSINLPVSMASSKYMEHSSLVRLPDREPLPCVTVNSFNPKTNGCWSHRTISKNYSKDAVSKNTMEVL